MNIGLVLLIGQLLLTLVIIILLIAEDELGEVAPFSSYHMKLSNVTLKLSLLWLVVPTIVSIGTLITDKNMRSLVLTVIVILTLMIVLGDVVRLITRYVIKRRDGDGKTIK